MKIKIIFPSHNRLISRIMGTIPAPPHSIEYLAGLTPEGTDIELVDMTYNDNLNFDDKIDIAAIHVRTPVANTAYSIADEFKNRNVTVIIGGPHPTLLPNEAILHSDTVCIGEAEETWPLIIDDFINGRLKKYYVAGPYDTKSLKGEYHHIPKRPALRSLPHARRELFPREKYALDAIFISRGCSYECRFCAVKCLQGEKVRFRPVDEVVAEVSTFNKPFFMAEENALGYPEYEEYYTELFKKISKLPRIPRWSGASTLSMARTKEGLRILEAAAKSGFFLTSIGFETVSQVSAERIGVLRKMGYKKTSDFSLKGQKKAIEAYRSFGISIIGFFVIGFDEDDEDTFKKIINFCDDTKILPVFTLLSPFPGSQLYEEYRRGGRLLPDKNWDTYGSGEMVFKHPTFEPRELEKRHVKLWKDSYAPERIIERLREASKYNADIFFHSLKSNFDMAWANRLGEEGDRLIHS